MSIFQEMTHFLLAIDMPWVDIRLIPRRCQRTINVSHYWLDQAKKPISIGGERLSAIKKTSLLTHTFSYVWEALSSFFSSLISCKPLTSLGLFVIHPIQLAMATFFVLFSLSIGQRQVTEKIAHSELCASLESQSTFLLVSWSIGKGSAHKNN